MALGGCFFEIPNNGLVYNMSTALSIGGMLENSTLCGKTLIQRACADDSSDGEFCQTGGTFKTDTLEGTGMRLLFYYLADQQTGLHFFTFGNDPSMRSRHFQGYQSTMVLWRTIKPITSTPSMFEVPHQHKCTTTLF